MKEKSTVSAGLTEKACSSLVLKLGRDGALFACKKGDAEFTSVTVSRCFPWSNPYRFISLRDSDGDEYILVNDVEELCAASREVLIRMLKHVSFTLEIQQILEIEQDFELRNWKVITDKGERTFQTELDEWPQDLADGGMLIEDVAGDLYRINDVYKLNAESRKHFWSFMD